MELFYALPAHIDRSGKRILLDGDEFHHLVRVLRKKTGDRIQVTDGCGLHLEVLVTAVGKHELEGDIVAERMMARPHTRVTVALSLLKAPQRFDFFLEKATELGISRIIPMITARTVAQPTGERVVKKLVRWRNIMLSAARQSRRYYLPEIGEPISFGTVAALEGFDCRLIPYELSAEPPSSFACTGGKTLFLVGGEGGFTAEEVIQAKAAGFSEISFGRSILRAETAAIFAVSLVRARLLEQAEEEDWL
ncbi:MAG: 16S rRNA (uracil(1498)-N(3))-methyltransferase [Chlorobium sp.]|jgi:16S rRNA (uracil1498-N3)-methyltransferase|uniref:16S rRNA (uracil(1498)-N(3))-methyltransferase n=1 Tax=Chlorobium sp. TaxID=1095 RepID=UPI001DCABA8E|nr:16S rRNA (uracil(1498)-N(3))-methyltransferase [Chlorobium sp.]MBN1278463.1 16S rRNA (uracil(1498)-N(3))-methyltransferase [Chlorobiaceae bacterium]MCF8215456.1 16S rRNA (uracil(1498)-N(3))-methyltransferase [Chlorobium sp.]MCF8270319.1 16S rRNA (uracil(1498)-N(3))-methyltransferase [Chlorobium sp.]MCF8286663.1 16S rRNA (uracil(1498)-N(3))-methyltransferase [Chlorobium sp.]MCF8290356.1 16S rRNA (uracil(1498)-N(3))-methyltransferase [Chlorobium sp.]